ncbi:xanthine dehydrogenase accessory protein XdhC [Hoeflea prorocentri]|uniref:Xanthine dehydrogenase accessory protein XdhC n=1 Tax=Hoeflea prorocentri TaxID=1922333 RepID=A0A9X3UK23_9HYPH|nr:xanthine dehydrogenase accessory protein XdhC [Hoeflea prorocentri]MCY6382016.1 xanthine dehydrogenase accessory protein XdhC [Hoeflea prorocentri]MDA5399816.1 xanthine dehydrogenase accessory protein XdhC [Hoeflea prorocentri]
MARQPARLKLFLEDSGMVARVNIVEAKGSTPREAGTWMLVSQTGLFGTIGGGQLELMAINEARSLLAGTSDKADMDIPLGPEIGQCCGGRVRVEIDRLDKDSIAQISALVETDDAALPHVYVFGAGHVGKALGDALSLLPVRAHLVETRQEELDGATADVEKRLAAMPEELVRQAPPHSAFIVMTHEHALDFIIVREALARTDTAYVGMIGSKTKRATYVSWHNKEGGDPDDCDRLICPIGASALGDKRPAVIAALVACEVMTALNVAQDNAS